MRTLEEIRKDAERRLRELSLQKSDVSTVELLAALEDSQNLNMLLREALEPLRRQPIETAQKEKSN